ncbi:MAG: hypothetical protein IJQ13_04805 [Prevotella sp.]|nr:hypothetical protein [Prevotella sp.]
MKKIFTLVAMAMMAIGANAQTLIGEKDWTGGFEGDYPFWQQFADGQEGSIASDAEGVAITVGTQTGELWQPQIQVMDGLTLEEDHDYKVVVTAKFPGDGTLQINMGNWDGRDQYTADVTATGDFQEVEVAFDGYAYNVAEGSGFVLFQCGDFAGTTILKKVQVYDMSGGGEEEIVDITSKFTYTWNENESFEVNEDGSITFNSQTWGGLAAWVAVDDVPVDWSGYSKVVFEYAEPTTVNTQILVGDAKAWGDVGITSLECSFEGVDMSAISQIALQTSEPTTIVIKRIYLVVGGASGIKNIKAEKVQNNAIYNLAGQKVDASYKGIVIQNGKKFIQK